MRWSRSNALLKWSMGCGGSAVWKRSAVSHRCASGKVEGSMPRTRVRGKRFPQGENQRAWSRTNARSMTFFSCAQSEATKWHACRSWYRPAIGLLGRGAGRTMASTPSLANASVAAEIKETPDNREEQMLRLPNLGSLESEAHALDMVRTRDVEGYMITSLLPASDRRAYVAIRALNVELASVRDAVRDNVISGRLRLQWWREVVLAAFNLERLAVGEGPSLSTDAETTMASAMAALRGHPIAEELARAVVLRAAKSVAATGTTATPAADQVVSLGDRFTLSYFLRAIECREIDLEQGGDRGEVQLCTSENGHGLPDWEQGFVDGDLADLETFWERCLGSLLALNLEVIGGKAAMDPIALHAASLLARSQGIATSLRGVRHNALTLHRLMLPRQLLERHGIDYIAEGKLVGLFDPSTQGGEGEQAQRGRTALATHKENLRNAVREAAGLSWARLKEARNASSLEGGGGRKKRLRLGADANRALLSAVPTEAYLRRLEAADFDVYSVPDPSPLYPGWPQVQVQLKMWFHAIRGSF